MCCRCNRNRRCCNRNCRNRCRRNWTDDIPTRRILVNDLEALENRAGGCGCCNCGCGCEQEQGCGCDRDCDQGRDCDCDRDCDRDCRRNRERDCGSVGLFRNDDIEFANVFNNHCSCGCRG